MPRFIPLGTKSQLQGRDPRELLAQLNQMPEVSGGTQSGGPMIPGTAARGGPSDQPNILPPEDYTLGVRPPTMPQMPEQPEQPGPRPEPIPYPSPFPGDQTAEASGDETDELSTEEILRLFEQLGLSPGQSELPSNPTQAMQTDRIYNPGYKVSGLSALRSAGMQNQP